MQGDLTFLLDYFLIEVVRMCDFLIFIHTNIEEPKPRSR